VKSLILALACLAGCDPLLSAQTPAPPGRTARLDPVTGFWGVVKSYRLDVSHGVALAVTCTSGGPCEKLVATSENPAVAEVRPASLSLLQPATSWNQQTAAAFVVVGKTPGTTRIQLHTKDGSRTIAVTVDAAPR
jgi:hypothetical protein